MNSTEYFLKEYWFIQRSVGHMLLDLSAAQAAEAQLHARQEEGTPPGHAERLIASQRRAEVMAIEARLEEARGTLARIETALKDAGLSERERQYVRLRYFENRSAEAVCQRMYVSPATGGRIREKALAKLAACTG
jgi:DNA-directed RNA polymerase specialized sigma24 family protein